MPAEAEEVAIPVKDEFGWVSAVEKEKTGQLALLVVQTTSVLNIPDPDKGDNEVVDAKARK